MNTRQKGRKHELDARKLLEAEGWKVLLAPTPQRWQKAKDGGTDLFGLFDLIGVNEVGDIRFIQVKSNVDSTGKKWKEDASFFKANKQATVEIWIYIDRVKEPRVKEI